MLRKPYGKYDSVLINYINCGDVNADTHRRRDRRRRCGGHAAHAQVPTQTPQVRWAADTGVALGSPGPVVAK